MTRIRIFKWLLYSAVFILVSVLQFTPHMVPRIAGAGALLLVPTVVCTAMFEGETAGAAFGAFAGLLWDTQGGRVFGFDALFLILFGLCAGLLAQYLLRNTVISALILTFSTLTLYEIITWLFFRSLFGDNHFVFSLVKIILPDSLYTLVFTFPFYYGIRALSGWLQRMAERARAA